MNKKSIAYWLCQILGWGSYAAVGIWLAGIRVGFSRGLVVGYGIFFVAITLLTHLFRGEIHKRQWLSLPLRKAAPRLAGGAILVSLCGAAEVIGVDSISGGASHWNRSTSSYLIVNLTIACLLWTVLYVAITATRRALEMRLHLREAQLRALENQVNPHFLFNSLNTIRGMIVEDAAVAQDMVTRLANILRYNLQRERSSTVPLEREMEIVADYLAIESIRFDDRLTVRMEIDPTARQAQVPSMLVQTLVENAVKHGIGSRTEGGEIVIRAALRNGVLSMEVVNSGQLSAPREGATQIGIANARERLHLLYGDQASLRLENRGSTSVAAMVLIPA
jgi:two-component system LytT family sensor kinase